MAGASVALACARGGAGAKSGDGESEHAEALTKLMKAFLIGSLSGEADIGADVRPFRIRFVRSVWDVLRYPDKTEGSYEAFVDILRQRKLLIE
jgi:hypothetical protein